MDNKYISQQELANLYQVSTRTVFNWRQEGLPTVSEKPVRFDLEEAKAWIKRNRRSDV